jgi:hypothetical protein
VRTVDDALYSKLTADTGAGGVATLSTGGIFRMSAPETIGGVAVGFPRTIYQEVSGVDVYTLPARSYQRLVYMVKAVAEGHSALVAMQIAERLDAILTDGTLTLSSGTCFYIRRTGHVEFEEPDGEKRYQHVGGFWDLLVK